VRSESRSHIVLQVATKNQGVRLIHLQLYWCPTQRGPRHRRQVRLRHVLGQRLCCPSLTTILYQSAGETVEFAFLSPSANISISKLWAAERPNEIRNLLKQTRIKSQGAAKFGFLARSSRGPILAGFVREKASRSGLAYLGLIPHTLFHARGDGNSPHISLCSRP